MIALPSPNFDERPQGTHIDILLLHYTGMKTADEALRRLCDPAAKVSAHYVVEQDGAIYRLVDESKRAWHAGKSRWAGATDINARSIGIEIVNPGHEFGYRPFPKAQMAGVVELARAIVDRHRIRPERVLGHSDVAPMRKSDPGELFDWRQLAQAEVGLWPIPIARPWNPSGFAADLRRFGYDVEGPDETRADVALRAATLAFCRHFRPSRLTDSPDDEMAAILHGLIDAVSRHP